MNVVKNNFECQEKTKKKKYSKEPSSPVPGRAPGLTLSF